MDDSNLHQVLLSDSEVKAPTSTAQTFGVKQKKKKEKPLKVTPSHFISIRVSNPSIHAGIYNVQKQMVRQNPQLEPTLVLLPKLHLTLGVLNLKTEDDIEHGKEALQKSGRKIQDLLDSKDIQLIFRGLGTFRNQVLFAKVVHDDHLEVLNKSVEIVKETFEELGIPWLDKKKFTPHMTVAKLSRTFAFKKKALKNIPKESYQEYEETTFGVQVASKLELLAMLGLGSGEDRDYYKCLDTFELVRDGTESTDHSECCDVWREAREERFRAKSRSPIKRNREAATTGVTETSGAAKTSSGAAETSGTAETSGAAKTSSGASKTSDIAKTRDSVQQKGSVPNDENSS